MRDAGSEEDELLVHDEAGVRVLTLNRPARANALSPQLSRRLADAFAEAEDDASVRAVVLASAGGRHFCAGADLKMRSQANQASRPIRTPMRGARRSLFEIVLENLKPTIAAVEGAAFGAGLELALCCDLRVASKSATFCLPEARRGLSAHYGTVLLPQIVPRGIAFEMLLGGAAINSERAFATGLVNKVAPDGGALEAALQMAHAIAANAPLTVRRMKETMSKAQGLPTAAALRLNEGLSPLGSLDSKEGARAFVEGRPPKWQGQ